MPARPACACDFFVNDPATTEIYTLSLHDALPIFAKKTRKVGFKRRFDTIFALEPIRKIVPKADRKSTRLNSSHVAISYAVFCLKKKRGASSITPAARSQRSRQGVTSSVNC